MMTINNVSRLFFVLVLSTLARSQNLVESSSSSNLGEREINCNGKAAVCVGPLMYKDCISDASGTLYAIGNAKRCPINSRCVNDDVKICVPLKTSTDASVTEATSKANILVNSQNPTTEGPRVSSDPNSYSNIPLAESTSNAPLTTMSVSETTYALKENIDLPLNDPVETIATTNAPLIQNTMSLTLESKKPMETKVAPEDTTNISLDLEDTTVDANNQEYHHTEEKSTISPEILTSTNIDPITVIALTTASADLNSPVETTDLDDLLKSNKTDDPNNSLNILLDATDPLSDLTIFNLSSFVQGPLDTTEAPAYPTSGSANKNNEPDPNLVLSPNYPSTDAAVLDNSNSGNATAFWSGSTQMPLEPTLTTTNLGNIDSNSIDMSETSPQSETTLSTKVPEFINNDPSAETIHPTTPQEPNTVVSTNAVLDATVKPAIINVDGPLDEIIFDLSPVFQGPLDTTEAPVFPTSGSANKNNEPDPDLTLSPNYPSTDTSVLDNSNSENATAFWSGSTQMPLELTLTTTTNAVPDTTVKPALTNVDGQPHQTIFDLSPVFQGPLDTAEAPVFPTSGSANNNNEPDSNLNLSSNNPSTDAAVLDNFNSEDDENMVAHGETVILQGSTLLPLEPNLTTADPSSGHKNLENLGASSIGGSNVRPGDVLVDKTEITEQTDLAVNTTIFPIHPTFLTVDSSVPTSPSNSNASSNLNTPADNNSSGVLNTSASSSSAVGHSNSESSSSPSFDTNSNLNPSPMNANSVPSPNNNLSHHTHITHKIKTEGFKKHKTAESETTKSKEVFLEKPIADEDTSEEDESAEKYENNNKTKEEEKKKKRERKKEEKDDENNKKEEGNRKEKEDEEESKEESDKNESNENSEEENSKKQNEIKRNIIKRIVKNIKSHKCDEDDIYPDVNDCKKFYRCVEKSDKNKFVHFHCENNKHFDFEDKKCVKKRKARCFLK